jgi:hypothetical protein
MDVWLGISVNAMNYEQAVEYFKDDKRPSIEEFINYAKKHFIFLQSIYGDAWVLQAIEIAEDLRKAQEK